MKRCPKCQNTFDDSMRFCQIDGTPLVEDAASSDDPYKTTVAGRDEISGGAPVSDIDDENPLQLHDDADPNKTMIASGNLSGGGGEINLDDLVNDVKKDESSASSPFSDFGAENKSGLGDSPAFGSDASLSTPPQSSSNPFSNESSNQSPFGSAPPVFSPFDAPSSTSYQPPSFKEPEQQNEPNFGAPQTPFNQSPFEQAQNPFGQPLEQTQWTPPPAPEANWQNQNIGANTPFQPPMTGQGQNQTLPIVSLVFGILSVVCCWLGFLAGPAALITGYMARNNANNNPQQYGGGGMALAGMITGGIGTVISVGYFLLLILGAISSSF